MTATSSAAPLFSTKLMFWTAHDLHECRYTLHLPTHESREWSALTCNEMYCSSWYRKIYFRSGTPFPTPLLSLIPIVLKHTTLLLLQLLSPCITLRPQSPERLLRLRDRDWLRQSIAEKAAMTRRRSMTARRKIRSLLLRHRTWPMMLLLLDALLDRR
jgi:hypothetical protein